MDRWTELKTAYKLAKLGTLSAAAEELGIHRSTVMRQIDVLEESLGIKLFQRNDKGYIATDAGLEIMRLGEITDTQINHFVNKVRNKEDVIEGNIKITCVNELSLFLLPTIEKYQQQFPKVSFEIKADIRKYDLEYGEADLAIRTGEKPSTLDNVVMPFQTMELLLCAHKKYIAKYGMPSVENLDKHKFVANSERLLHLPWNEWIHNHAGENNILLTSSTHQVLNYALNSGIGISVAPKITVQNSDLLCEVDIDEKWSVDTWILIHRDLVNIPKIRKFVDLLKINAQKPIDFDLL